MNKEETFKVLEAIRHLDLSIPNKKDVANCYESVSQAQKQSFLDAVSCYEGRVNYSFKKILYDKYVYALYAKFNGESMFEYLMKNEGFKYKRANSFKI